MADPFSILTSTVGLIDVCVRTAKYIKEAYEGTTKIDRELDSLVKSIDSLANVSNTVNVSFKKEQQQARTWTEGQFRIADLWASVEAVLQDSLKTMAEFNALIATISDIKGPQIFSKLDGIRKWLRKESKEREIREFRDRLTCHCDGLQLGLSGLNLAYLQETYNTATTISAVSKDTQNSATNTYSTVKRTNSMVKEALTIASDTHSVTKNLSAQIARLERKWDSSSAQSLSGALLSSAKAVVPSETLKEFASLNEYFNLPQAVSSIYTGRTYELEILKQTIESSSPLYQGHTQRRFVIYGIGGAGKTQFCCKFAQENRQSFWGIFWIDASSNENAIQSLKMIARVGKVDPNERAAKTWLSNQTKPWLLIIDNANDDNIQIEDYFPPGGGGFVLITTTNPKFRTQGTFDPQYFEFACLEETESSQLLLTAAGEATPWTDLARQSANIISKAVGFLPLALVYAGSAILDKVCTLQNYLYYFEEKLEKYRNLRRHHLHSLPSEQQPSETDLIIYSTYEMKYNAMLEKNTQASQDACDLLKIFAFLNLNHIRYDIFIRAVRNPKLESEQEKKDAIEEKRIGYKPPPKTWDQVLRSCIIEAANFIVGIGSRSILPGVLRDHKGSFDEFRLLAALKELRQRALISDGLRKDTYSLHPVIHKWARERKEMTLLDQAVWCRITGTVIAQSILFPPLDETIEGENFKLELLPHVEHVMKYENKIAEKLLVNQESRIRLWPILRPQLDRNKVIQLAKFAVVFGLSGRYPEAEVLLTEVAAFVEKVLGIGNPRTIFAKLALSGVYWLQGRGGAAADLQLQLLEACRKYRGEEDPKTLKIMDMLGVSRWQQGRVAESILLHQVAVEGFKKAYGDEHLDTLRAMGHLGRSVGRDFRLTEAIEINKIAVAGLSRTTSLGPYHLDTLEAKDNLAMAYFDRAAHGYGQPGDVENAYRIEVEVYELRRKRLGNEHPLTLWAMCNFARILSLQGDIESALALMRRGLEIAERNMGSNTIAMNFGKIHLGRILLRGKLYKEAEEVLSEVVNKFPPLGEDGAAHADRIIAIFSLIKSLALQGRTAETEDLKKDLFICVKAVFGEGHAWEGFLLNPKQWTDDFV